MLCRRLSPQSIEGNAEVTHIQDDDDDDDDGDDDNRKGTECLWLHLLSLLRKKKLII